MLAYLSLARPKQWIKNGFVLAPLLFSLQFQNPDVVILACIACLVFTLASSATYALNDIADRKEDRLHPKKKLRPLASGAITVPQALIFVSILITCSVVLCFLLLPADTWLILAAYALLQLVYTSFAKHIVILDVICIASGFVLRVLMGAFAIGVAVSPWIILTTFMLSLFMGFGKRYRELEVSGYESGRISLQHYSGPLLDRMISISCGATLMSYALYTVEMSEKTSNPFLVYTTAFVAFGLFRYLYGIYVTKKSGEPEDLVLRDRAFQINLLLWLFATLGSMVL